MSIEPVSVLIVKSDKPDHEFEKHYQLKEGDIYVEAGAFYGRQGLISYNKGCKKIVLIEPSPVNIATIENLIKEENLDKNRMIIIKKGVYSSKGKMKFYISGPSCGHSFTGGSGELLTYNTESIEIETDTLDNILTELNIDNVDLLSCDVEGGEIELVKSLERYLTEKRIKNIALGAYHHPRNHEIMVPLIQSKGFKDIIYDNGVIYGHI